MISLVKVVVIVMEVVTVAVLVSVFAVIVTISYVVFVYGNDDGDNDYSEKYIYNEMSLKSSRHNFI